MKKIHRYITKNFLLVFLIVFVFFIFLFVLSDFFSRLGTILKSSVPVKHVLEYYIFYTPFIAYFSLPFIFGLSSVISLGYLSFRNEIIVMRSSGLSIFKISMPIFLISIIVGAFMFFGKEYIVNYGLDRASYIKHYYFKRKKPRAIWLKVDNYFIRAKDIDVDKKRLTGVTAYLVSKNFTAILRVLESKSARFEKNKLVFLEGYWIDFPFKETHRFKALSVPNKTPFVSLISTSQFREPYLKDLIKRLKMGNDKNYYLSLILFRFLYPISCVVLSLLSLVFILKITPRKSGFISNVFLSAIVFLTYIAGFQVVITMGKYSMINPPLSIAIFMLFWITISLYNLLKLGI